MLTAARWGAGNTGQAAQIRQVTTGRVVTRIRLPDGDLLGAYNANAAAAGIDNRTFFLHLGDRAADGADGESSARANDFYRIRIDNRGNVAESCRIWRWSFPGQEDPGNPKEVAVSPDGTKLAFVINDPTAYRGPTADTIMVVSLATGRRQVWRTAELYWDVRYASWLADGRRLMFAGGREGDTVRILDTARSGDPAKISKPVRLTARDPRFKTSIEDSALISPDGTKVYRMARDAPGWTGIAEYDVATGRRSRVLLQVPHADSPAATYSATQTCRTGNGRYLLAIVERQTYQIDVTTGRVQTLGYPDDTPQRLVC